MQHPQSRKLSSCFLIQLGVIMKWTSAALYRYEIKQAAIQTSCLSFWSVVMVGVKYLFIRMNLEN